MKISSCWKHLLPTVAFLLFSGAAVHAVTAAETTYEFISRSTDGANTGYGTRPQVTPDGRFVVYVSSESTLVTPNAPGYQIYLHDRLSHTTELISMSNTGDYGNSTSDYPSISNDGCKVVFASASTNLASANNVGGNIFVRDRCTSPKRTSLVSANGSGTPGDGQSKEARISGNGHYAAFMTYATNIGSGSGSVVRKDLVTGAIVPVSLRADTVTLDSGREPDISYDGSRIAFWSYQFDGATGWDIYLWVDPAIAGYNVSRVSTGSSGELQVSPLGSISGIHSPGISGNGRYVSFVTGFDTGNTAFGGGNGKYQVYVKDTQTGVLALASVSADGTALGNDDSGGPDTRPALSHNGKHVAFTSKATNLVTSSAWMKPLVRDLVHNQTILVADRSVSSNSLSLSNDDAGRFSVFSSSQITLDSKFPNRQGVYLADLLPSNNLLQDPGFEMGAATPWTQYSTQGVMPVSTFNAHLDSYSAYLCGYGLVATEAVEQSLTIPANANSATVEFWSFITTSETTTSVKNDTLTVELYDATGSTKLATVTTLSNLDAANPNQWVRKSLPVNVAAYKGQTVRLRFTATENASLATTFFIDDVSLTTAKGNLLLLLIPTLMHAKP